MGDRSGKAICRTPDMNAVEGSDRAVVPMKLPNKQERVGLGGGGGGKSADQGERCGNSTRARHRAGKSVSQRLRGVREVKFASTRLSKVRAVCGNAARTDLCG